MFKRLSLIALLAVSACDTASVPLASSQSDAAGKQFAPPPAGQAALYVVRGGDVGTLISATLGARNLGPFGNNTWMRYDVAPGVLDVRCVGGEASKAIEVTAAAGELRFVEIRATTGWWAARCDIVELSGDAGRAAVMQGKRAIETR
ncbi:MAG: hypothetical protein IKE60_34580 [Reyranella sp.]|uniref:hypothetical protein n=1 Tax=Reyranella sp. TaxID=1929291 RepID=UPI0025FF4076|nr:hypothetical protein [Reyranella sp.]MBR2819848.1 hypothetical protein [Reyranella sp.]